METEYGNAITLLGYISTTKIRSIGFHTVGLEKLQARMDLTLTYLVMNQFVALC